MIGTFQPVIDVIVAVPTFATALFVLMVIGGLTGRSSEQSIKTDSDSVMPTNA